MLELHEIKKIFNPGTATEVTAVRSLTARFEPESFTVAVGANGSGKSTLLNLIAGSIYPDGGRITLHGRDIKKLPDYRRSRWIARVFQNPLLGTAASLTVLDNFRMAALRRSVKWIRPGTDRAFVRYVQERVASLGMGLEDKLAQSMGTLSGGQRQALTLLMTVMTDVDILLLDEPSAALDPRSARQVMEIAERIISENKLTALLVTHNISEALRYGNRLIQMENGQIVRDYDRSSKASLSQADVVSWFDYY